MYALEDLNNPDTRQALLIQRLEQRQTLVVKTVADELGVSVDTIRRDLITLENRGLLKRVKGGAIPVSPKIIPFTERVRKGSNWLSESAELIQRLLAGVNTLYLDGGTSTLEFAHFIPHDFQGVVVTPSPVIASVTMNFEIETIVIGGRVNPSGVIATGSDTVTSINQCHADLCVLGTCGLHPEFGLSAYDYDEAAVKKAMALNSDRVIALASQEKLNTLSRHKVIDPEHLDILITNGSNDEITRYQSAEIDVYQV